MWTDPGNIKIAQKHMNVEIWNEAAQFPEKEYINGIFVAEWYEIHSFYTVLVVAIQYFATRFGQTKKQKQAEIFFPALKTTIA
jgi:hypothetical protein